MIRLAIVLTALAMLPVTAKAHSIGAEAKLVGNQIVIEAYYDDDTVVADADVTVTDATNTEVAFGRTDAAGRWSFPTPIAGSYRVVVDAGAGHRARMTFTVPDRPTATEVVSDGPTRNEFTGISKWVAAVGGLVIIAIGTMLARRFMHSRIDQRLPEETQS